MKIVIAWMFIACAFAQSLIVPTTLADVAGDGAAHQFATSGSFRWLTVCALKANAAKARIGDSAITATRGIPVEAGSCFGLHESTGVTRHSLAGWYYLVQSGDSLSITYGQ